MKVAFTLKNATLEETYVDPTNSTPIKVLIANQHTFKIENFTIYDEAVLNATASAGSGVGTASSITSTFGSSAVVLGTVLNLDMSGSMIKALQFILLFDKLRLINVKLDNLLGTFMTAIYEAFKVNLINVDDYEETAKYS